MKKAIFKARNNFENQKKLYIIILGLAMLSLISGIIFIFLISDENNIHIQESLTLFFSSIKDVNKTDIFISSIINNSIYITLIWLLGISIIGLPIIIIMSIFKFFIFGFSLSSIFSTFKWNGIYKAVIHMFPHQVIYLIILVLVSFYSISFCIKLFNYLFFKKNINFKEVMHRYLKILLLCLVVNIFISLYEAYVSTYLLNLFN